MKTGQGQGFGGVAPGDEGGWGVGCDFCSDNGWVWVLALFMIGVPWTECERIEAVADAGGCEKRELVNAERNHRPATRN